MPGGDGEQHPPSRHAHARSEIPQVNEERDADPSDAEDVPDRVPLSEQRRELSSGALGGQSQRHGYRTKNDFYRLKAHLRRSRSATEMVKRDKALPNIKLLVVAMSKKSRSKPMTQILERLRAFNEFDIEILDDQTILDVPQEDWPDSDCLISFFSTGFPLAKAQAYARRVGPYLINDLHMQNHLLDRRAVYRRLLEVGIPIPRHIVVNRDPNKPVKDQPAEPPGGFSGSAGEEYVELEDPEGFVETEDYVEFKGERVFKPFVEKPVSGEDHNIYIYYPHSMGGGVKRLFRKVADKSADYDSTHPGTVRRDGSYIYEAFLATSGTDVKVYTVGPRYAHAEARKSPVVDGRVVRTPEGKEVRFPVLLSPQEKEIARIVSLAFGQKVCGFDLLRSDKGRSYVCDVNGWSFVKSSKKYYDDCAGILRSIILSALAPHRLIMSPPRPLASQIEEESASAYNDDAVPRPDDDEPDRASYEELRCVLAVVRHGDRTPKQKVKVKVSHPLFLELLRQHMDIEGGKAKQAKLKTPQQMQDLLDATRQVVVEYETLLTADSRNNSSAMPSSPAETPTGKSGTVRLATAYSDAPNSPSTNSAKAKKSDADDVQDKLDKLRIVKAVLEQGGYFSGVNRKAQMKPTAWEYREGELPRCTELLLIVKHGGVLTHAGRQQAERLGVQFRSLMYPRFGPMGGGLLRLHSTYRHDMKIYCSDEGRVQCSAAAFTKGLLDLEGNSLTPILVSLVKKDARMLDVFDKGASMDIRTAKHVLYTQMTYDALRDSSCNVPLPRVTPMPTPGANSPPHSPRDDDGKGTPVHKQRKQNSFVGPAMSPTSPVPPDGGDVPVNPRASLTEQARMSVPDGVDKMVAEAQGIRMDTAINMMPEAPLQKLHMLYDLLTKLMDDLRKLCQNPEVVVADPHPAYSAMTQSPQEWVEAYGEGKPCGGERMLLMYDRWRKLHKALYNPKKRLFDISKIPDVYDSAKFDAIHNHSLHLPHLEEVYNLSKTLADCVIPNEYGVSTDQKLRIGQKVCDTLLGKLLSDLANVKEESFKTAEQEGSTTGLRDEMTGYQLSLASRLDEGAVEPPRFLYGGIGGLMDEEEDDDMGNEPDMVHRLCPTYADDVNSPLRHVRTRVYFTSESHLHALINVLRFCDLPGDEQGGVVSEDARQILCENVHELDYLSQIVFRMYENKRVPLESPKRFRVEILFSSGASFNPFKVRPVESDHVLPVAGRIPLHAGDGIILEKLAAALRPLATEYPIKAKVGQGRGKAAFRRVVNAVIAKNRMQRLYNITCQEKIEGASPPETPTLAAAASTAQEMLPGASGSLSGSDQQQRVPQKPRGGISGGLRAAMGGGRPSRTYAPGVAGGSDREVEGHSSAAAAAVSVPTSSPVYGLLEARASGRGVAVGQLLRVDSSSSKSLRRDAMRSHDLGEDSPGMSAVEDILTPIEQSDAEGEEDEG
ncbi:unnamed protein product [Pedinophyceae sp. YPF-701]|nr:unnamed protein product [Pedinophyceae sp. YPF-701]